MKQIAILLALGLAGCNATVSGGGSPLDTVQGQSSPYQYRRTSGCVNGERKKGFNPNIVGQCADLANARLFDANLRGVDLRGANLKDGFLDGADLSDADLRGANLINIVLEKTKSLKGARYSVETLMPINDTRAENLGMIKVDELKIDTELFHATVSNDVERMRAALSKGADPWTRVRNEPLFESVLRNRRADQLALFTEFGHDVERSTQSKRSLVLALEIGDEKLVAQLLRSGADPNANDGAALVRAIRSKFVVAIGLMFDHGLKLPSKACSYDSGCLIEAANVGQPGIFDLLLQKGASPDGDSAARSPLLQVLTDSSGKDTPYLDLLLKYKPKFLYPPSCGTFVGRARQGAVVRKLLAAGASAKPNSSCGSHAYFEIFLGSQSSINAMTDAEIRELMTAFKDTGTTPTQSASGEPAIFAFVDSLRLFALAVETGVDWKAKDTSGSSVYERAVFSSSSQFRERLKILTFCLDRGASLDEVDRNGSTLVYRLILNSMGSSSRLVDVLGAITGKPFLALQKNVKTGRNLLHALLVENRGRSLPSDLVKWLVDRGVKVEDFGNAGDSVLSACSELGCLNELTALGASPKTKNSNGENLVIMRMRSGLPLSRELVNEYKSRGVDLNEKNKNGQSALDVVLLAGGSAEVIEALRSSRPDHPGLSTKYFKCEDASTVVAAQIAYSDLGRGEFAGESIKSASKASLADVSGPDDPTVAVLDRRSGRWTLTMTPKYGNALQITTSDFEKWNGTWGSQAMTCSPVAKDPLPSKSFKHLFVDCRSTGQYPEWMRLNHDGYSWGMASAGGRKSVVPFRVSGNSIFTANNGYTIDLGSSYGLYIYIPVANLKQEDTSKPLSVYTSSTSVSDLKDAERQDCVLRVEK